MTSFRIATFNVENLFSRPKAFTTDKWGGATDVIGAWKEANELLDRPVYTDAVKAAITERFLELDIYRRHSVHGSVRRNRSGDPTWAWFRRNRGRFDREPRPLEQDVEIVATGRDDWLGWVELSREATDEVGVQMTARVINDLAPDVLAVVEAEDRMTLQRFNHQENLLDDRFDHVMLIDGNDDRGIDVGLMTMDGFDIGDMRSHVDAADDVGVVFSRDCPEYEVAVPGSDERITLLVNHFKSQSGGGGAKRARQAAEVRRIVDRLVGEGRHVVVLGDLNEGQSSDGDDSPNFADLFSPGGPLLDCYALPGFDLGPRPGTFQSCSHRNRLDYVLISRSLESSFRGGQIYRRGLWGDRKTRPTLWETYPEINRSGQQASDHAAVAIDLEL